MRQVLNDTKEQIFMLTQAGKRSWVKLNPGYAGNVGKPSRT